LKALQWQGLFRTRLPGTDDALSISGPPATRRSRLILARINEWAMPSATRLTAQMTA
jgi:hypothetical protein